MSKKQYLLLTVITVVAIISALYVIERSEIRSVSVQGVRWERGLLQQDPSVDIFFTLKNVRNSNMLATLDIAAYRLGFKGTLHLIGEKQITAKLEAGEVREIKENLAIIPLSLLSQVQVRIIKISEV